MYKTSQTCAIWSSDWMYYCRAPSNLTGPFGSTGEMDNSQGLLVHLPTKHGVCNECPLFCGVSNQNPHKEANLNVLFDFYLKNGTCGYMWCIECGALSFFKNPGTSKLTFCWGPKDPSFSRFKHLQWRVQRSNIYEGTGLMVNSPLLKAVFCFCWGRALGDGHRSHIFSIVSLRFWWTMCVSIRCFLNDVCLQLVGKMCFFPAIMSWNPLLLEAALKDKCIPRVDVCVCY